MIRSSSGGGIYAIAIRNKTYIGSAVNFERRWDEHLDDLEEGKHSSRLLQQQYDRHGKNALSFRILERCDRNQLEQKERKWIEQYYRQGRSLNVVVPGHPRWNQSLRRDGKTLKKRQFSGIYLLLVIAIASVGWWIQGLVGFWIGAIAGGILLRKKLFQ